MNNNLGLQFSTQRLIIRPLEEKDYESWLSGFVNRHASQYKYDKGQIDMSDATEPWFAAMIQKHQQAIEADDLYIFAVFDKAGHHLGMLNIKNLSRDQFQWAEIGYFIHNQYWASRLRL